MGPAQSASENPPPMIFRGETDIPIRFSPSLIGNLERRQNKSEPARSTDAVNSSNELERQRLDSELSKLREEERMLNQREEELTKRELESVTPSSVAAPSPADGRSVSVVAHDVEELLRRNKEIAIKPLDPQMVAYQKAVVECYKKNEERPLDCWREVDQFKESVRSAQRKFISNHA